MGGGMGSSGVGGFMNGERCLLCKRHTQCCGQFVMTVSCKSSKLISLGCAMRCHTGGSSGMGVSGGLQGGMNGGMNGGMMGGGMGMFGGMGGGMQGMQGFMNGGELCVLCKPGRRNARGLGQL